VLPPRDTRQTRWPRTRHVVHYVDARNRLYSADAIDSSRLQPVGIELIKAPQPGGAGQVTYHVNLQRASVIFELEALRSLQGMARTGEASTPVPAAVERACQCLRLGIEHDLAYKSGIGQSRPAGVRPPSIRLYDLLARVSIRYDRPEHFQALRALVEQARKLAREGAIALPRRRDKADVFARRMDSWERVDSEWRKATIDPAQPLSWKAVVPGDVRDRTPPSTAIEFMFL
jgi:hypothetical protein